MQEPHAVRLRKPRVEIPRVGLDLAERAYTPTQTQPGTEFERLQVQHHERRVGAPQQIRVLQIAMVETCAVKTAERLPKTAHQIPTLGLRFPQPRHHLRDGLAVSNEAGDEKALPHRRKATAFGPRHDFRCREPERTHPCLARNGAPRPGTPEPFRERMTKAARMVPLHGHIGPVFESVAAHGGNGAPVLDCPRASRHFGAVPLQHREKLFGAEFRSVPQEQPTRARRRELIPVQNLSPIQFTSIGAPRDFSRSSR